MSARKKTEWENDAIQFPRLIAELNAAGVFKQGKVMRFLRESMNLHPADIWAVVYRAERAFEKAKRRATA